ncbi:hypothetical protein E4T48_01823 [Aureobasidium sp. EXF-10727]|nr:hypothetical protein E4T48_01823 [Aureobasidium sp. EXF-10727]KAI4728936.1 hypothetical protein E4T49_03317 [Aureobasidium sp. EXF-10728]
MKVKILSYHAVAAWRWDMPEDDDCGICRVQFDGSTVTTHNNPCGLALVDRKQRIMSAVNKPSSHSFAQTTDDSTALQQERDDAASSVRVDQAVTTSDGLFDDPTYPNVALDHLLPPPDFRPFFTLIEDPDTGEHHHPSVHYIFSDDNPDFLTSTIVDRMDQEHVGMSAEQQAVNDRERMILLDMAADGKSVREAQSLSPHWQILTTTVGQAPSWADEVSRKDIPGLMLNIQGMESAKLKSQSHRRNNSQEDIMARIEAMIGGYNSSLSTLESMIKKDVLEDERDVPLETAKMVATQDD